MSERPELAPLGGFYCMSDRAGQPLHATLASKPIIEATRTELPTRLGWSGSRRSSISCITRSFCRWQRGWFRFG